MKTISKLATGIVALLPASLSYAAPAIYDMDISVYYESKDSPVGINLTSSRHDTENAQSTFLSWIDDQGQYYVCTSKESAARVPPRAKTAIITVTVDPSTWKCSSFSENPVPPISLTIQCQADGQNIGTGTGKSRRATENRPRRYNDRYDSNSALCSISIDGEAPVNTQGWLLNKQSRLIN